MKTEQTVADKWPRDWLVFRPLTKEELEALLALTEEPALHP